MKIHTDILTGTDLYGALEHAHLGHVDIEWTRRGSRSRARGFDFRLTNDCGRRWRNSGQYGAECVKAATWDEHGHFFAQLFDMDPSAIIGPYNGREDFHAQTGGKYRLTREEV